MFEVAFAKFFGFLYVDVVSCLFECKRRSFGVKGRGVARLLSTKFEIKQRYVVRLKG